MISKPAIHKKQFVIHPFLFGIFPLLALFVHNIGEVSLVEVLLHVAALAVLILFILKGCNFFVRDKLKSGILVSFFLLFFFSFGHFYDLIADFRFWVGKIQLGPSAALFSVFLALFSVLVFFVSKAGAAKLEGMTKGLNLMAAVLLLMSAAQIVAYYYGTWSHPVKIAALSSETSPAAAIQKDKLPDIYYIILDGYSRADMLKKNLDFDNTAFLERLKEKGFFINKNSRSNYAQTYLSFASALNMSYLDEIVQTVGPQSENRKPLKQMISKGKIFEFLKQHGYKTILFSSGFIGVDGILADQDMSHHGGLSEFQNELLNTTAALPVIRFINKRWGGDLQYDLHRKKIQHVLDHLLDPLEGDKPVFVFAHILAPHAPFVFGRNGEPLTPKEKFSTGIHAEGPEALKQHNAQLTYLNKRIEKIVDALLARPGETPIILLQSDHGLKFTTDIHSLSNSDEAMQDAFFNLGAYYFPSHEAGRWLYEGITPVNVFRVIFNRYFNAQYDLLEDRSYFSTAEKPFDFKDVTDRIHYQKV